MTDQSPVVPVQPTPHASSVPVARTQSLYRKYRPQTFDADELVGQEHVVRILRNAIRLDRIAHAYLFCGPRGTGKTTTARLLAKAVNCLDPDPDRRPCNRCGSCLAIAAGTATDVIEIDAASNRGIDDIRDLRERVKYAPVMLRTKFYIVDEAHQITGAAANAFLKTLEEPPAHTKFVLATTDPEELLPTIVSRCQRFDFRRIGFDASVDRLRTVATAEGLAIDDAALAVIARHSTGSLRDGLSLLDQLSLYTEPAAPGEPSPPVTVDMVRGLLGVSRNDRVESLVTALADHDPAAALGIIGRAMEDGEDPRQINRQLVAYLRVLLHQRAGGTADADDRAQALAARFDLGRLADLVRRFSETDFAIKHAALAHLPLELGLVDATLSPSEPTPRALPQPEVFEPARGTGTTESVKLREVAPEPSRPPTALRDRVRGGEAPRPSSPRVIEEAPGTPRLAEVPPAPVAPVVAQITGALTVDQLADLWPRIRLDVKSINRRIEALLASVDPVRVNGTAVTLVAAYPFHRDRLNTDEVRDVVEAVIGRIIGQQVQVQCTLRAELPAASDTPTPSAAPGPESAAAERAAPTLAAAPPEPVSISEHAAPTNGHHSSDEGDADQQRLRAAKNIFDAEEIKPADATS